MDPEFVMRQIMRLIKQRNIIKRAFMVAEVNVWMKKDYL